MKSQNFGLFIFVGYFTHLMIKCTDGDGGGSVALVGLCLENLIGLMIG